jgi:hypothetical protein
MTANGPRGYTNQWFSIIARQLGCELPSHRATSTCPNAILVLYYRNPVSCQAHIVRFKMYENQLCYLNDTASIVDCSLNTSRLLEELPYIRAPVSFRICLSFHKPSLFRLHFVFRFGDEVSDCIAELINHQSGSRNGVALARVEEGGCIRVAYVV